VSGPGQAPGAAGQVAGQAQAPIVAECSGWTLSIYKAPILKSDEMDKWSQELELTLPEMVFGNNRVEIHHQDLDVRVVFCAKEALALVGRAPTVEVSCAEHWQEQSKAPKDVRPVHQYDWTYTTPYNGTVTKQSGGVATPVAGEITDLRIDFEKLKPQPDDKMLLYDDVLLFEDELHDNGISALNVRLVCPHFLFFEVTPA